MPNLNESLEVLYELDKLRDRAKGLREQGRSALKGIRTVGNRVNKGEEPYGDWVGTGNKIEAALLLKVQHHRNLSRYESENDKTAERSPVDEMLNDIAIGELFIPVENQDDEFQAHKALDRRMPVLLAARAMQFLASRSATVLSEEALLCYYRIVRELYTAEKPDWTIGAARSGEGGSVSAFVTGSCISAILALEHSVKRTVEFFERTRELYERHEALERMIALAGEGRTPDAAMLADAKRWADKAIERMWFDWFISTNPRLGEVALHAGGDDEPNRLFRVSDTKVDMAFVKGYLDDLIETLSDATRNAVRNIEAAKNSIAKHRDSEVAKSRGEREKTSGNKRIALADRRSQQSHDFAWAIVEKALKQATEGLGICGNSEESPSEKLKRLSKQFANISRGIRRVLEPSKKYIETVLNRELAESETGEFDAGELVFAAAAFGAMTDWKQKDRLRRACGLLEKTLPGSGILPTKRPIHSTHRGYKLLPVGAEINRRFAQLLEKTHYEFGPAVARKMLSLVEETRVNVHTDEGRRPLCGWTFEGATETERPSVWVTAVTVLALDRIVRMLNSRINEIVFSHFEVVRPEQSHTDLTLNDLIYSDYDGKDEERSIAVHLEQMRAHLMRTTLPDIYKKDKKKRDMVFSTILDGPPQTGKTTLAESLALSSKASLIMLSPFDLTLVEAGQTVEGRARAVFEALSMLTQTVILFDEFEPVLRHRQGAKRDQGKDLEKDDGGGASSQPYEFLLTGMLPKLIKLHDAAQKHSFVYFLATNHLDKMDDAAVRPGRFDARLFVDHPDPLSRKGTFLYRLQRIISTLRERPRPAEGWQKRLSELLSETEGVASNSLANDYFKMPEWVAENKVESPEDWKKKAKYFAYVMCDDFPVKLEKLEQKRTQAAAKKRKQAAKKRRQAAEKRTPTMPRGRGNK